MFERKNIAALVAEFLGVFILSLVVYSMLARTSFPLFSGIAAGLSLAVFTLAFGAISGAHVNPAVTVSMWVMRKIDTIKAILYIAAQMLGALAAWGILSYFLDRELTNMAAAKFDWRVAIAEGLGTAIFAFGAAAALLNKLEPAKCAFVIGGSFALGVMAASLASNGILNPAVAFGIRSWDWSYAVAPLFGAIIGSNIYYLLYTSSGKKVAK